MRVPRVDTWDLRPAWQGAGPGGQRRGGASAALPAACGKHSCQLRSKVRVRGLPVSGLRSDGQVIKAARVLEKFAEASGRCRTAMARKSHWVWTGREQGWPSWNADPGRW